MSTVAPDIATTGFTHIIRQNFEKSVPLVRRLLRDAGLSIVQEFSLADNQPPPLGGARRSCIVLLVDTPGLFFECVALDRAAAAFVPIHVVVCGDKETSYVHWEHPLQRPGPRAPIPSRIPLEELCSRLTKALGGLPEVPQKVPDPHAVR
jgi:hypothetical protein